MSWPSVTVEFARSGNWNTTSDASLSWTDISAYVLSFGYKRGRRRALEMSAAGTCTIELDNSDGRFLPGNIGSPYYSDPLDSTDVGLRQRRRIRITSGGSGYSVARLFTGYIDAISVEPMARGREATATITCVDALALFAKFPTGGEIEVTSPTDTRTYTDTILTARSWPATWRSNDGGTPTPIPVCSFVGEIMLLTQLQRAARTELGNIFVDGQGYTRFWLNSRFTTPGTPAAIFSTTAAPDYSTTFPLISAALVIDYEERYSHARLTGIDGVAQEDAVNLSRSRYGTRYYQDSALLCASSDTVVRADQVTDRFYLPQPKIESVVCEGVGQNHTNLWNRLLTYEIGTAITVAQGGYGIPALMAQTSLIEGIDVRVTEKEWRVTWHLSSIAGAQSGWFLSLAGASELGTTTYIGAG